MKRFNIKIGHYVTVIVDSSSNRNRLTGGWLRLAPTEDNMATKKVTKKAIDLSGTSILLSETERKFLYNFIEYRTAAEAGLEYFSKALNDARKDLWKEMEGFHPEIKDYHSNYNALTGEIKIIKKKG